MKMLVLIGCLVALANTASAGLTAVVVPTVKRAVPGIEVAFTGTLTNTSGTDKLYLNDIAATLTGPSATQLALKPNAFFSNVPGILLPNEAYSSGEVFRVVLDAATPVGDYTATITFRGGSDMTASTNLATAAVTVHVGTFEVWSLQHFGDQVLAEGDEDQDGAENLLEFAMNLDPLHADRSASLKEQVIANHLTLSYVPNALATDVNFMVEGSTDLIGWSTTLVEETTAANGTPGLRTFRLIGSGNGFLRLHVTQSP